MLCACNAMCMYCYVHVMLCACNAMCLFVYNIVNESSSSTISQGMIAVIISVSVVVAIIIVLLLVLCIILCKYKNR